MGALLAQLARTSTLAEAAALALALGLAWLTVHALRGRVQRARSVWFGAYNVDGVLFPLLALLFALAARWALLRIGVPTPLALFQLALPILASLLAIRFLVRVLRVAFPQSALVRAIERTVSWAVWIALVLWLTGVLPLILAELDALTWKVGGADVSLRSILEAALTAVVVLVVALWISSAVEHKLLTGATHNLSMRKIASNAVRATLLLVGLLFALSAAGIPLGALSVLGGALGVGIGFGLQKLASNYVSGFVILAERSLNIGDTVKVDNFEGKITDISTRFTVVRAANGRQALIPNEMLITQRVENASLADPRTQVTTTLRVAYGTDLDALIPRLLDAVRPVPRVIDDPAPVVELAAFGADAYELTVGFWIRDADKGQANVKSAVNLALVRALAQAGVEIAYPQSVVITAPGAAAGSSGS